MSRAGRAITDQAAEAAIDSACRLLRLPTVRARFTDLAEAAGREQLSYRAFLSELLLAECDERDQRRRDRRVREAGFPVASGWTPSTTRSTRRSTRPWSTAGRGRLGRRRGTAVPDRRQRHRQDAPAHRLGDTAAEAGHRVRYVHAARLVNELVEAADERQLTRTIARYGRIDLLCLDELGYMELDRRGAELLFQVLTEREERASVAIASNVPFSGWTSTFTDPRLCAAIVDRLTFGGHILETGTTSYRLAHARQQQNANKAASAPAR